MTDEPLDGDQTLECAWCLDGEWGGGTQLTPTTSTTTKHTWNVNESAQDIKLRLTLGRTNSVSPRVTGIAVKFLLPKQKVHTFYLKCAENALMKNGDRWDNDPDTAIDNLFGLTDEYITCTPDWGEFTGLIDEVSFVQLERGNNPNVTHQGIVKLVVKELA